MLNRTEEKEKRNSPGDALRKTGEDSNELRNAGRDTIGLSFCLGLGPIAGTKCCDRLDLLDIEQPLYIRIYLRIYIRYGRMRITASTKKRYLSFFKHGVVLLFSFDKSICCQQTTECHLKKLKAAP